MTYQVAGLFLGFLDFSDVNVSVDVFETIIIE